ncbi:MAG TPA: nuclear transport factor 2 family protein [Blastocatellia bacterium]|nr:nuclear transport factor 2 family protein [Blastocatellia bacterium]HMV83482.1 nuclear transport factor 2 family protein [Blastocatellia bacterium]HMX29770.1 nuclear transport factor 2 family protein [Blastocatellia bacterium]HMY76950.1 nuclear transport factor 2 family protein [Blastocatellia bacterium]HMZ23037.1 nuclear transport factor 2 family protein [Blastocatellia bacterium]
MKKLIWCAAALTLAIFFSAAHSTASAQTPDEREAVRLAVLDYVEGVYNVDPSRIERSVHPDLAKRGFWDDKTKPGGYATGQMTYSQLIEVAKTWNKNGRLKKDAPKEITVFEVLDQTASAKLVAQWGIDYFHLAKYEGKWKIVNVLWQSPPPKKD